MRKLEIFYHMFLNQKKRQILGGIISRAFYADDLIRFINKQLKDWSKAKFNNKLLDDASVFLCID